MLKLYGMSIWSVDFVKCLENTTKQKYKHFLFLKSFCLAYNALVRVIYNIITLYSIVYSKKTQWRETHFAVEWEHDEVDMDHGREV